jgi:hypothetical protein
MAKDNGSVLPFELKDFIGQIGLGAMERTFSRVTPPETSRGILALTKLTALWIS